MCYALNFSVRLHIFKLKIWEKKKSVVQLASGWLVISMKICRLQPKSTMWCP